jgi:hypothetical protein
MTPTSARLAGQFSPLEGEGWQQEPDPTTHSSGNAPGPLSLPPPLAFLPSYVVVLINPSILLVYSSSHPLSISLTSPLPYP